MSRRSAVKVAGVVAVAAAMCAIGATAYHLKTRYPKRLVAIVPGRIYSSGQPNPAQLDRIVREKGLKMLANFRREAWHEVRGHCVGLPPTDEEIRQVLDLLDDERNCPVLVHCSAGVERSGMVAAIYRIERMGWSNERAVEQLLANGVDTTLATDQVALVCSAGFSPYAPIRPEGRTTNRSPLGPDLRGMLHDLCRFTVLCG